MHFIFQQSRSYEQQKLTEKFNFHCHCWQGHQKYEWNHQKNPKRLIIISHLQFPISLFLSLFECWTAKDFASWCVKSKMLVKNRQKCRTLWSCKTMVLFIYNRSHLISALWDVWPYWRPHLPWPAQLNDLLTPHKSFQYSTTNNFNFIETTFHLSPQFFPLLLSIPTIRSN